MTDKDKQLLRFERAHPRVNGVKDQLIWEQTGLEPTAYYQRLNTLLDDSDAYLFDPQLVKRLRRLRDQHRAARSA